MPDKYPVRIKVISQKGTCVREHKVGDEWVMNGGIPGGMCPEAFHAIYPNARILMFGGAFPWESDPDVTTRACSDGQNPVIFELTRIKE